MRLYRGLNVRIEAKFNIQMDYQTDRSQEKLLHAVLQLLSIYIEGLSFEALVQRNCININDRFDTVASNRMTYLPKLKSFDDFVQY